MNKNDILKEFYLERCEEKNKHGQAHKLHERGTKQEHTYQVRSGPVSKAGNESACLYKVDFIVGLFPNYLGRSSLHTEKYSSELSQGKPLMILSYSYLNL